MKKESQNDAILAYMREGKGITPIEALELCGCLRLSGRIFELKERGYNIKTEIVNVNGKRVARYHLIEEE